MAGARATFRLVAGLGNVGTPTAFSLQIFGLESAV
jgi:hypothetical protein